MSMPDPHPSPADSQEPPAPAASKRRPPTDTPRRVAPFLPQLMETQLTTDRTIRGSIIAMLGLCIIAGAMFPNLGTWTSGLTFLLVAIWIALSMVNARATQELAFITAMAEDAPPMAESVLAGTLSRWPLQRWVRLMLYHRLAIIRHHQQRYAEAAAICTSILRHRLGAAREIRITLLLIGADSHLHSGDLWSAWQALSQLHAETLSLPDRLKRLAVQTRYELACNNYDAMLHDVQAKVQLAELMPATQSGIVHAMLAVAAEHRGDLSLTTYLRRRAELLCDPQELRRWLGGMWNEAEDRLA